MSAIMCVVLFCERGFMVSCVRACVSVCLCVSVSVCLYVCLQLGRISFTLTSVVHERVYG